MSTLNYIKKCASLVRKREDFSSSCSSGFGQWLLANLLALFTGISWWQQVVGRISGSVMRHLGFPTRRMMAQKDAPYPPYVLRCLFM